MCFLHVHMFELRYILYIIIFFFQVAQKREHKMGVLKHFLSCIAIANAVTAIFKNYESLGAKPDDDSYETALKNGQLMNETLNSLEPGDVFFIPNSTYTLVGGIVAQDIFGVTIQIDGTLNFTSDRETWPKNANGDVMECIHLENLKDVLFTSSGKGTLNGNGRPWWGAIKFLKYQEDRPRLMHIVTSKNVIIENLLFKDSPFWTFFAEHCDGMIIRYSDVDARWTDQNYHTLLDLQAFNTDGFDVTGHNVYIHDCNIWNQDDCIAVKDDPNGSYDMLFERISCSGLGLVIGSIGTTAVNNITFRDSIMPNTVKGIYMKTRWSDSGPIGTAASISNILFENIVISDAQQFPIWIGPAQQTGQPCSLLWPIVEAATCDVTGYLTWTNITLRNITINDPWGSAGNYIISMFIYIYI